MKKSQEKIKFSKEQQKKMLAFFSKTSIPRMLEVCKGHK